MVLLEASLTGVWSDIAGASSPERLHIFRLWKPIKVILVIWSLLSAEVLWYDNRAGENVLRKRKDEH